MHEPVPGVEHSASFAVPPTSEGASVASVARSVPITRLICWLAGAVIVVLIAAGGYILRDQNDDIYHAVEASSKASSKAIEQVGEKLDRALGELEKIDNRVREVERWTDGMREWRTSLDEWRKRFDAKRKGQ